MCEKPNIYDALWLAQWNWIVVGTCNTMTQVHSIERVIQIKVPLLIPLKPVMGFLVPMTNPSDHLG